MTNSKQKIAVGISGGVDSAVSALLLKQAGYEPVGIFMQNWETEQDDPFCTAQQDLSDARAICDQIGIPLYTVNFAREYWNQVFQHCLDEFAKGRTPNPDIWCNREIKFKVFLEHALKTGASKLATGHYAGITEVNARYQLIRATDHSKDQTYFLYTLGQYQLAHSLFPLAKLLKKDVRDLALRHQLINYAKKDSTGICFIGERKFKSFMQEFILAQPGNIETTEGKVIGKHDGIMFYTLGQRKGLNIGGQPDYAEDPWYVLDKDVKRNILIVGQGNHHPLLYSQELIADQLHWVSGQAPSYPIHCTAKTRYRQPDQQCKIHSTDGDSITVIFNEQQRAVTPGQSIVFYHGDICLGGGIIKSRH